MEKPTVPIHASARHGPRGVKAADALFSSYGGRLFAYFHLMLANWETAKRALADTLVAAADDIARTGRLRDLDQYAPRLFALARTECHRYQSADAVGAGRHWTAGDGVYIGGRRPELPDVARRAVSRLSPDVREAFILSAPYNRLSLPQLAEVLGVGLDAAADRRAQAGLEFVRAVALCAQEADFTEFSGADLRIRAEESLARDASEPPPSLPILSDPALAAFREGGETQGAVPPRPALPPRPASLGAPALPAAPASGFPAALPPGFPPAPAPAGTPYADAGETTRVEWMPDAGPLPTRVERTGGGPGIRGAVPGYRGPGTPTGPMRALTGPLPIGDRIVRGRSARHGGRRRRAVAAWAGGVIAAAAGVVIAVNALASGPDNTITLTHDSGAPTGAVSPYTGLGAGLPGQSHHRRSRSAGRNGAGVSFSSGTGSGAQVPGSGTAPVQGAPRPTQQNPPSPAPVRTTKAPAPSVSPKPTSKSTSPAPPTTPSPSDSSTTPPAQGA